MYKLKDDMNTQDTNLSWYVANANMDHTIHGQRAAVSTLDHSATTPTRKEYQNMHWKTFGKAWKICMTTGEMALRNFWL